MTLYRIEFIEGPRDGEIKQTAILKSDIFLQDESLQREVDVPFKGGIETVFYYHKYVLEKRGKKYIYKYQGVI